MEKNFSFLLEDYGFFIDKIKITEKTKIYIFDEKMIEIRRLDSYFFEKEIYNFYNVERQMIFIENCIIKYEKEDLLVWKMIKKEITEKWLLVAIGLYNINKELKNKKFTINNLLQRETILPEAKDIYGGVSSKINSNLLNKNAQEFNKEIDAIENQWKFYIANSGKEKEKEEIQKLKNLLKKEKEYSFIDEEFDTFHNFEDINNKIVAKGYFLRNINNFINYNKNIFVFFLNKYIKEINTTKEDMYYTCFKVKEKPNIRDILKRKKDFEFKDYNDFKVIINYLKNKITKKDWIEIDYLFIKCLKFKIFETTRDYEFDNLFTEYYYPVSNNWLDKAYKKLIINDEIIYVQKVISTGIELIGKECLYEKNKKYIIKKYSPEDADPLIGRIYRKEDIEKIKKPIAIIERTLNNN